MTPLPAPVLASTPTNIADYFTKPLSLSRHQRSLLAIGDNPTTATPTATVATAPTVDTAPTVVASASTATATTSSDSVPLLHPNSALAPTHPNIVLDTGASFSIIPFRLDFISGAPFGLIWSAASVVSKATSKATLSNNPYTLITGEDVSVDPIDLSSPDLFALDSDSVESFDIWEFGTATLVFISNPKLTTILVEPTVDWTDWFDWTPLPRLTPTESYFHIFGRDYSQAFALFHLLPIWIYCLLHFGLE